MSERKVIDCDKCGKVAEPHIRINIPDGYQVTPGPYPDRDYLYVTRDLCAGCAESLLRFMLGHRRLKKTKEGQPPVIELKYDKVHPIGDQETEAIELARKYFGIKRP